LAAAKKSWRKECNLCAQIPAEFDWAQIGAPNFWPGGANWPKEEVAALLARHLDAAPSVGTRKVGAPAERDDALGRQLIDGELSEPSSPIGRQRQSNGGALKGCHEMGPNTQRRQPSGRGRRTQSAGAKFNIERGSCAARGAWDKLAQWAADSCRPGGRPFGVAKKVYRRPEGPEGGPRSFCSLSA